MKLKNTCTVLHSVILALLLLSACSCQSEKGSATSLDTPAPETTEAKYMRLAERPPMGWNSWNIFHGDIDEEKIRGIADKMVETGMRDAGYEYLVLDDGWMADKRAEDGKLLADPNKFPSGMQALGEYIHSKGLKYGIYQDRGHSTCMRLPGSFGHEQIDMDLFAEWGVDYLKLDSCYAEINGRPSSEDFGVYQMCIIKTGRPMILSMANYTDPSWAWGGDEIGHLWRTSFDIGPHMGSVYYCMDTSAGDTVIHPAFNGLWQFAGPGHWNDPDMLQVGNMKSDIENRTHFALWCILAAPLMAGNDLRKMSDAVRDILTNKELIAINQDPRGIQGYKVYDNGDHEIFNKPLADGTTAVLLLNRGSEAADITVTWDQINLKGRQKVRDLWLDKDLGKFKDAYTAAGLEQHDHVLLKIGSKGKALPTPDPLPPERYTVTRKGITHLSDLAYIWRFGNAPKTNKSFNDKPITIDGVTYDRGFGCKAVSKIMFKLNHKANHFNAVVGLDPSYQGDEAVSFKVRNEDPIGPDSILYDSSKMTKDSPAKVIDIDVTGIDCLILSFEGKQALGNWGDPKVLCD
jgi:hypothetical protein